MDFEDTPEELEEEGLAPADEEGVAEVEEVEIEELEENTKDRSSKHSLEVRRAIEDHLEETRLRKELDYLFDDEFPVEEDE